MKVIIVGAGASGVTAAINLKRKNPNDEILIIEHLDKPLKKILATGNGKCNLGNTNINFSLYNNPLFAKQTIDVYNFENFFDSISIKTKTIGDLAYPVSESAVSVREAMLNELRKLHVKLNVNEQLIDYKVSDQIYVKTNVREYTCDKLILAGGLKSSSKLGSDGSVVSILKNHQYKINNPKPGLSPIRTKEETKLLDGIRVKANVKLYIDGTLSHQEDGEVLFKDHGLSGIVIFNTMSLISRNEGKDVKISIDLLPNYSDEYLQNYLKGRTIDDLLLAFINPKISAYLKTKFENEKEILSSLKKLEFSFDKSYGFDFSQVSVGGIDVNEINETMMSKREPNVYIVGELVDIDGPCGGYNLTWAFASALKI